MADQAQARQSNNSGNAPENPKPTVQDQAQAETDLNATRPAGGVYVPNLTEPGDTPRAGDVDPESTDSADDTGQAGDVAETKKRKGLAWS
jgi:hypothetical protein